jgi:F-type H+-transporting ATPase subunit b
MREVIQKVIETETEAKRLVEAATAEADSILSKAQKEAEELLVKVRRDGRTEAEKIVEAAKEEAEREKQECLARALAEINIQVRLDQATIQRAVEGLVRCVCRQNPSGRGPVL